MEYNTQRSFLSIREYGRHVQKMVACAKQLKDDVLRQRAAEQIVAVMLSVHPTLKNTEDGHQKAWDHLFVVADFDFAVQSPYPRPSRDLWYTKPDPLPYPGTKARYLHLGYNVEMLIQKALEESDGVRKQILIHVIIQAMRQVYVNRHKEMHSDEDLKTELSNITQGRLLYEKDPRYAHLVRTNNVGAPVGESYGKPSKFKKRFGRYKAARKHKKRNGGVL